MDSDREYRPGQVPLPGFSEPEADYQPAPPRRDGIRHARRMSNWTLAALIAGTGAATVALAHHAFPSVATMAGTSTAATAGGQATANGTTGPQVGQSVATTSGSGATVTTTTKTVNGKTVVVRTVHPAAYHDN
jgi:hypothetical protein